MPISDRFCPSADALTVSEIRETAAALSTLLERGEPVTIDLCEVREVDVSGLQLLIAARRSAERANNHFSILAGPNDVLEHALVRAGFLSAGGVPRHVGEQAWGAMQHKGAQTV